jgi:hypothetical protein
MLASVLKMYTEFPAKPMIADAYFVFERSVTQLNASFGTYTSGWAANFSYGGDLDEL